MEASRMTLRRPLILMGLAATSAIVGAANAEVPVRACENDKCQNMSQCVDAGSSASTGCDMIQGYTRCQTYECQLE